MPFWLSAEDLLSVENQKGINPIPSENQKGIKGIDCVQH